MSQDKLGMYAIKDGEAILELMSDWGPPFFIGVEPGSGLLEVGEKVMVHTQPFVVIREVTEQEVRETYAPRVERMSQKYAVIPSEAMNYYELVTD